MQTKQLSHKDQHTVSQIFQHPASHNLEWHDVIELVEHLGSVEESANGHLTFTLHGASQVFHRSQGKDVSEVQQVLDLRHMMESHGISSGNSASGSNAATSELRLLVVVNQRETRVFRSEGKDSTPEHLHPYDPHGVLHHLNHSDGPDVTSREPKNIMYYQDIAKVLAGANEVLLMGDGTGASSAMSHLQDYLTIHDPEIAKAIVGALTVNLDARSEGQLLAEARAFFMHRNGSDPQ